jgi:acid phosphatase
VQKADTWLRDSLDDYVGWAMTHNSLVVVTWDEDAHAHPNNLYGLLRTLLEAYCPEAPRSQCRGGPR